MPFIAGDVLWRRGGSECGWGLGIVHPGDLPFATWFTYDEDGMPLWLSATAARSTGRTFAGTLVRHAGPPFPATPFDASRVTVTAVGQATLAFADGASGTFSYTVSGVLQVKPIARRVFSGFGTTCR